MIHHRSLREQFHTYLQSLSIERSGVSAEFQWALERALRDHYYGVTEAGPHPSAGAGGAPGYSSLA